MRKSQALRLELEDVDEMLRQTLSIKGGQCNHVVCKKRAAHQDQHIATLNGELHEVNLHRRNWPVNGRPQFNRPPPLKFQHCNQVKKKCVRLIFLMFGDFIIVILNVQYADYSMK